MNLLNGVLIAVIIMVSRTLAMLILIITVHLILTILNVSLPAVVIAQTVMNATGSLLFVKMLPVALIKEFLIYVLPHLFMTVLVPFLMVMKRLVKMKYKTVDFIILQKICV